MNLAIVKISPSPGRRQEVLDILESVCGPTLAASGCLECSIYQEQGEEQVIVYLERWRLRAEMIEHLGSPIYSRVLGALELSEGPPEISFYEITGTEGMELIEGVRSPPGTSKAGGKVIAFNGKPITKGEAT
ncbi:putative quinol monooxygenase [Geomonas sp.]|uniref:putative quinol monooxygenase n=1 Tax=Geomonas sp. TaxID=2651584 RepID=UPI002B4A7262|nr:putative quinol monooxygenase [Geomonas sp.]HJV35413.1 putative quinol monooxygenase [Geomonas sp.]